jgi:nucleoside-diphosphate kinase
MERSLVLIKPDAMERGLAGTIIGRLEQQGLKLLALKMLRVNRELAGRHYAIHKDKPFYNELVDYITSTPIVAAVFEGEKAIETVRQAMGATDPSKAGKGTIRGDYGLDIQRNSTHASDSVENGKTEIGLFFGECEIFA